MSCQATELKPDSILRFLGDNREFYECVFYYDFQTEAALRMINLQDGTSMIDPNSMINE